WRAWLMGRRWPSSGPTSLLIFGIALLTGCCMRLWEAGALLAPSHGGDLGFIGGLLWFGLLVGVCGVAGGARGFTCSFLSCDDGLDQIVQGLSLPAGKSCRLPGRDVRVGFPCRQSGRAA